MSRICFLDDSEIMRELVKEIFETSGFEVFLASGWAELNPIIFRKKVDLVLLDVHLPSLSGEKICQILKESVPGIRILLFSSLPEGELEHLAKQVGADGWISKDWPEEKWVETVKDFVSKGGLE